MTHTNTLIDITNEIEALDAQLSKINALVDLIGQPAIIKADEVIKALDEAKGRFSNALSNQVIEDRAARLRSFSDIHVVTKPGNNLLDTAFTIHYTRKTWDINLNDS